MAEWGWPALLSALVFAATVSLVIGLGRLPGRLPTLLAEAASRDRRRRRAARGMAAAAAVGLLRGVESLHERLGLPLRSAWLDREILLAGEPAGMGAGAWIAASEMAAAAGAALGGLFAALLLPAAGIFGVAFGLVAGAALPLLWIRGQSEARAARLTRELPHAVDLLALAMGAGASFPEAVRAVVRRGAQDAVTEEFRVFLAEIDLGRPERESLAELGRRTKSTELNLLAAGLAQGLAQGVPVVDILQGQSAEIRQRRSQLASAAAAELPVKLLFPSLVILAASLLVLFGPLVVRMAQGSLF
jgi:Flp pilus assembly protein TadB